MSLMLKVTYKLLMLNVVMLIVVMLNIFMLSVVMLNVFILSVVAPKKSSKVKQERDTRSQ